MVEELHADTMQYVQDIDPRACVPLSGIALFWCNSSLPRFNNLFYRGTRNENLIRYDGEKTRLIRKVYVPVWQSIPQTGSSCEVFVHINASVRPEGFKVKEFRWELDEDYMMKLHCIRQAFEVVFMKESTRTFMVNAGKSILGKLLSTCQKQCNFEEAYDNLISFIEQPSNTQDIADTLNTLGMKHLNFYDVVLRFIVMKVLDDMENIAHVLKRGIEKDWTSEPLLTVDPHGFFYYLGEVFNIIIPDILLAYVTPGSKQKVLLQYFKKQVSCLIIDLFTYEKESYLNIDQLAKRVSENMKERTEIVMLYTASMK
ncbi:mitoguardin 1-like [Discoglossus pictus]